MPGRFATLVGRHDEGVAVYGPFDSRTDARLCGDWLGVSDHRVFATRTVVLQRPYQDPSSTIEAAGDSDVITVPDKVASLLTLHTTEPADGANPLVVLVMLTMSQTAAMLVGSFGTRASAREWCDLVGLFDAGCTCHVLPLLPSVLSADSQQDKEDRSPAPAVILLDTDDGSIAYGPFDNGMEAAVFWLDVTGLLEFTNVRRAHVCDLAPPRQALFPAKAVGGPGSKNERVRGWAVRLAKAEGEPELVGPFDDEHASRNWCDRTSVTGTVVPIVAP